MRYWGDCQRNMAKFYFLQGIHVLFAFGMFFIAITTQGIHELIAFGIFFIAVTTRRRAVFK